MWRAPILYKHFLLLQLVREMGKRKTLYLSNKHLPWLDEEQTLPLLTSATRWHHVLRKKLSPITTKPPPLLLRHRESPVVSGLFPLKPLTTVTHNCRQRSEAWIRPKCSRVYGENVVGCGVEVQQNLFSTKGQRSSSTSTPHTAISWPQLPICRCSLHFVALILPAN